MNGSELKSFENSVTLSARQFVYPPTPEIAAQVMRRMSRSGRQAHTARRWVQAAIALAILAAALMLVPPARAAVLDLIRIGVVTILRSPAPSPAATALPATTATPAEAPTPTITATSEAGLNLAGEMSLSEAQTKVRFPIMLPSYPASIGRPDRVYLQNLGGSLLLLTWLDREDTKRVRMSLQEISPGSWAITKYEPRVVEETQVNGQKAIWVEGPYILETRNHDYVERTLVQGHVLIWEQNGITYRLESGLDLAEAIKIAESLKPLP